MEKTPAQIILAGKKTNTTPLYIRYLQKQQLIFSENSLIIKFFFVILQIEK